MPRVGFLGPFGTFTEQALLTQADLAEAELVPLESIPDVLTATGAGEVDLGFVPLENSIEGTVNVTLDILAFEADLLIQREVVINVHLQLLAPRGVALDEVKTVVSFPQATAQVRGFLDRTVPGATTTAANSTAEAARSVGEQREPGVAAVGTAVAAELYGLEVLAAEIQDHPENQTRFVVVAPRTAGVPAPTGHDKTSIVCFQQTDRPGSLLAMLQEFAARAINLTKLESRPTKRSLGDYCFFIDFSGHVVDELVADCLRNLRAKQAEVKFLGSYPVAGEADAHARREAAGRAWRDAGEWIDDLRERVRPQGDVT
jgi:prephenate dehydratase